MTVAVAVPCSWLAVEMRAARRQKEAVKELTDIGCVHYDWEVNADGIEMPFAQPTEPEWLRKLLGDDFFAWVVQARVNMPDATDAMLQPIVSLSRLDSLYLAGSNITDSGLEKLTGMTRLLVLDVRYSEVTDEGVKKLQQALPNCYIVFH